MRMMESSVKTGFRRAHLLLLLLVFLLGALFLWYSLDTHPELHSRVDVLNTSQPMNVLVSVQGTALDPGFLGFIAVVQPHTRVLNVIPVSGLREVTVNHASEPLYQAVSDSKPRTATRLVSEATGVPIDHYFYLTSSDLNLILQALYYHSPNWPAS
ncbi:MAG: hypothetical protein M1272_02665, partial [Firmicutes bacterium]|nr:hypothetical protein [Bacillota bacterium]